MTRGVNSIVASVVVRRFAETIVLVVGFGALFIYGLHRIQLGVGLNDEGAYLADPMRYALGDVPFRDEFWNVHRTFDIVLWPVFRFFPDVTVYQLRLMWLVIQFGCVLAFYRAFRRFAPPALVAVGCMTTMYLPNLVWTPGYHVMGTFLLILSWSLLIEGLISDRKRVGVVLGVMSGWAFWVGAMSYLPLMAIEIVPVVFLAVHLWNRRDGRGKILVAVAHLSTVFILALTTVAVVGANGLWGDWWEATQKALSNAPYGMSTTEKFSAFIQASAPFASITGLTAGLIFLVVFLSHRRLSVPFLGHSQIVATSIQLAAMALLFVALSRLGVPEKVDYYYLSLARSLKIFALIAGLHLGVFLSLPVRRGTPRDEDWRLAYAMAVSGFTIFAFLQGFLSGMAWKMIFATIPLFVSGVILVYRSMLCVDSNGIHKVRAAAVATILCVIVGMESYSARSIQHFHGERAVALTHTSSLPRLAGIRVDPDIFQDVDAVVEYITDRTDEGDFLLVDGYAPLIYYLTGTRPAWDQAWMTPHVPIALTRSSLKKMIASERVPGYVVRFLYARPVLDEEDENILESEDPVAAFVTKHYRRVAQFGIFEVWKRVEDRPLSAKLSGWDVSVILAASGNPYER